MNHESFSGTLVAPSNMPNFNELCWDQIKDTRLKPFLSLCKIFTWTYYITKLDIIVFFLYFMEFHFHFEQIGLVCFLLAKSSVDIILNL